MHKFLKIVKKQLYAFALVLCFCTISKAGTLMFENANQLYRSKQYAEASDLYMQIINDGYGSSSVYYNAGNAFYKSNKLGYAIWCFNKALQYQTDKKLITDNLMLAKNKLDGKKTNENSFSLFKKVQELLNYYSLNTWATYAWSLFMIVLFFSAIRLLKRAPLFLIGFQKLFFYIFLLCFLATLSNYFLNKFNKLAIVVENATLYKSEVEQGIGHGTVQEGTQIIIKETKQDLTSDKQKIKLPNGTFYWVNKSAIRKL